MIYLILGGAFIVLWILVTWCLCAVAKRADERAEKQHEAMEKGEWL